MKRRPCWKTAAFLCLLGFFAFLPGAGATTITLSPLYDYYQVGSSIFDERTLKVEDQLQLDGTLLHVRSYLEFDIAALPDDSIINSAVLHLYARSERGGPDIYSFVGGIGADGVPLTIGASGFYNWSFSNLELPVNSILYDLLSFEMILATTDGSVDFTAYDYLNRRGDLVTATRNQPYLTLEYGPAVNPVPEPATLFLLGVGLIGMAGYSRKMIR